MRKKRKMKKYNVLVIGGSGTGKSRLFNKEEYTQKKLKEYEDLEEQGRLLKLPCKIGDTVYIIEDDCEGDPCCCYHTCDDCNQRNLHIEEIKFNVEFIEDLGEYVFLTKSEAEEKLKELRGGENEM